MNPTADRRRNNTLIPKIMDLPLAELNLRLEWIDAELTQLSSAQGVVERIHALKQTRAHIHAAKILADVMGSREEP